MPKTTYWKRLLAASAIVVGLLCTLPGQAQTQIRAGLINLATMVTGTLGVPHGGTGATSITGLVLGNGTSAMSAYGGASACTSGQFVTALNASGGTTCGAPSGAGTVTSVGVTLPGFTFTGSPVTTSGTIAGSLATGVGAFGGLLLEEHTASSSSELDFTTCLSSAYDDYVIQFVDVLTSAAAKIGFQMSTNGGTSYDSSTDYAWSGWYTWPVSNSGADGSTGDTALNLRGSNTTQTSGGSWNVTIHFQAPGSSSLYKSLYGEETFYDSSLGPVKGSWGGYYKSNTAVNAFRVIPNTGGLVSGTVRCGIGLAK